MANQDRDARSRFRRMMEMLKLVRPIEVTPQQSYFDRPDEAQDKRKPKTTARAPDRPKVVPGPQATRPQAVFQDATEFARIKAEAEFLTRFKTDATRDAARLLKQDIEAEIAAERQKLDAVTDWATRRYESMVGTPQSKEGVDSVRERVDRAKATFDAQEKGIRRREEVGYAEIEASTIRFKLRGPPALLEGPEPLLMLESHVPEPEQPRPETVVFVDPDGEVSAVLSGIGRDEELKDTFAREAANPWAEERARFDTLDLDNDLMVKFARAAAERPQPEQPSVKPKL